MTNEETIFAEALGKGSPSERATFLDKACAGNAALRREVEALAEWLQEEGHRAAPYHAGLADEVRDRNQEAFLEERERYMSVVGDWLARHD